MDTTTEKASTGNHEQQRRLIEVHRPIVGAAAVATLVLTLMLKASVLRADESGAEVVGRGIGDLHVMNERVHADLPATPLPDLLKQLADAAGIDLTLAGDFDGEEELYARGASLYRVVDHLLSDGHGYAFELDPDGRIIHLIVFTSGENTSVLKAGNERQRYLARQVGRRDDNTATIMYETLSDRSLNDSHAKLIAIEQLTDMDSQYAAESLQAGIGDPDPQVRLATAKALYRLRGDNALDLIGQIYYSRGSASIRKDVATLVAESSHPLARSIALDSGVKK